MRRIGLHSSHAPLLASIRRGFVSSVSGAAKEREVSASLRAIIEPVTNKRLSALGCINSVKVDGKNNVHIELDLIVPGYTHLSKVDQSCIDAVKALSWVQEVTVRTCEAKVFALSDQNKPTLSKIKHIIGISSCKGGVGKSTVATQLACALARQGLKIGILDADIYGPSLPFQLTPLDRVVKKSPENPKFILPLVSKDHSNLKMLSFGFVNPNSGAPGSGGQSAALVRGPIANKIITQMLLSTDWGELDYLLVDMPPGTGDIQITLSQLASFSGTVMVTTPHPLALVDAVKGMVLFQAVNIPTLAIVENMSYFECKHGVKHFLFGKGGRSKLLEALQTLNKGNELEGEVKEAPFHALPLVSQEEEGGLGSLQEGYGEITRSMIERIFYLQSNLNIIPSIQWDREKGGLRLRYFTRSAASEHFLPASLLAVTNAQTGLPEETPSELEGEQVLHLEAKGVYGVAIVWKKATKIFPYDILKTLVKDI